MSKRSVYCIRFPLFNPELQNWTVVVFLKRKVEHQRFSLTTPMLRYIYVSTNFQIFVWLFASLNI